MKNIIYVISLCRTYYIYVFTRNFYNSIRTILYVKHTLSKYDLTNYTYIITFISTTYYRSVVHTIPT